MTTTWYLLALCLHNGDVALPNRVAGCGGGGLNSRPFLRGLSLLIIAIVLTPSHRENTPFALTEVNWNLGRNSEYRDGKPFRSDYPNDRQILRAFKNPGEDRFVVSADYEGLQGAQAGPYLYTEVQGKGALFNAWPKIGPEQHYLAQTSRSHSWYQDFTGRVERLFLLEVIGRVDLLTRKRVREGGYVSAIAGLVYNFPISMKLPAQRKLSQLTMKTGQMNGRIGN